MNYITGDKLRKYYVNQTLGPYATTGYAPLSNEAMSKLTDLNNIPSYSPSYSTGLGTSTRRAMEGTAAASGTKFTLGDAAKSAAGVGADVLMDAGLDSIGSGGGLKGFFASTKSNLGNAWKNVKAGKGIAPSFAKYANILAGAQAGLSTIQGLSDYGNAKEDTDALIQQILASAGANPNLHHDLSADQLKTLRQLRSGTYDSIGDFTLEGVLGNLGNIATGAGIGFLTGGGPWGAILGGLNGVVDGIASGTVGNQQEINAELEALYNALYEAEMNNKAMRKEAAMQRYQQSLY